MKQIDTQGKVEQMRDNILSYAKNQEEKDKLELLLRSPESKDFIEYIC